VRLSSISLISTRFHYQQQVWHYVIPCSLQHYSLLSTTSSWLQLQVCDLWPQCWQSNQNCFLSNIETHSAALFKRTLVDITLTRLRKVIWQQAESNSPLVTTDCSTVALKITSSRGPIPEPNYLPHPWTQPTIPNCSKSDKPFCHNALDRQTHRWTDQQMVGGNVWWL